MIHPGTRAYTITQDLTHRITTGEWAYGQRLPTGQQLAAEYSTSVSTIRITLTALAEANLTETQRGSGTICMYQAVPRQGVAGSHDLADLLHEEIRAGVYRPGDPLPGARRLSTAHHLSPGTCGQALRLLVDSGVAHPEDRQGTYVVSGIAPAPSTLAAMSPTHRAATTTLASALHDAGFPTVTMDHTPGATTVTISVPLYQAAEFASALQDERRESP